MRTRLSRLLLLLIGLQAGSGFAGEQAEGAEESRWRLGAAIGYGLRSNPLVQSDDIPIIVDVDVAWFGDRFFFDNGDLGLTFADNAALTANLVARINSDRVFFGNTDTRFVAFDAVGAPLSEAVEFKVPERDYAVELGVELLADGPWGQVQFGAFHDVSGTHDGFEVYVDLGIPYRNRRFFVQPSLGASYKSAAMNDYYWGLSEDEAGIIVLPYAAEAGINVHARLMFGYQLTKHWSLSLVAELEQINDEAAASPIVDERKVFGYFAGAAYRF